MADKAPRKTRSVTEQVTPDLIRQRLVARLSNLAAKFATEAAQLESSIRSGSIPRGYIPVVVGGMDAKIDDLELFCDNTLAVKRRKAEKGKERYREVELEKKRASSTKSR